jgi:L,D-peptidoglycan transpeptidase YkuD (ErfK/YbiS/YcfS/YnhG family)
MTGRRRAALLAALATAAAITAAGCTSGSPGAAGVAATSSAAVPAPSVSRPATFAASDPMTTPSPTSAPLTSLPPTTPPPTSPSIAPQQAAATTKPPPPATTKPPAPPPTRQPLLVEQLASVGNARQVVVVTAANWTTDVATLQTFEKSAAGWRVVFPAMTAHIGRAGFSADKHEGDLATPAGKYGFGNMFGQRPNPGVKFPNRQADSQSVWVDDVGSPYYNTWQENAALSGEHLAAPGYATAYAYAVAIAYNTNPIVPGKGSAIFLHVSTGGGTAGCVSIAQANLLQVLRWLDPAKSPVVVMGPTSVIRRY